MTDKTVLKLLWYTRIHEYIFLVDRGYLTDEQVLEILKISKENFEHWLKQLSTIERYINEKEEGKADE